MLLQALRKLADSSELEHVRLILGVRSDRMPAELENFPEIHRIDVAEPNSAELRTSLDPCLSSLLDSALAGAARTWVSARLVAEIGSAAPSATLDGISGPLDVDTLVGLRVQVARTSPLTQQPEAMDTLLGLLSAVGVGPTAPLVVVQKAMEILGCPLSSPRLQDLLAAAGVLVARGRPGDSAESVGLAHATFASALLNAAGAASATNAATYHRALFIAVDTLAPLGNPEVVEYKATAEVRHRIEGGDSAGAVVAIEHIARTGRTADNHQLWDSWLRDIQRGLDPGSRYNIDTRLKHANARGNGGDPRGAVDELVPLLRNVTALLGPDHPTTLTVRHNIAHWTGESGKPDTARDLFAALLPDRERVLGLDHPSTLATRINLTAWTGEAGDPDTARDQFAALLPDLERILGLDHPSTLTTRHNLAYWTSQAGDPDTARDQFAALLPDRERILGLDHPDTLTTRHNLARWIGEAGDPDTARDQFAALLPDQTRVLGPNHPNTLTTRHNLATCTGRAGDPAAARDQLAALLPDHERILGPDHPNTLRTRNTLAYWTKRAAEGSTSAPEPTPANSTARAPDSNRVDPAAEPVLAILSARDTATRLWTSGRSGTRVRTAALDPDRTMLAAGTDTGTVAIWDATTHREVTSFDGRVGPVTALAFGYPDKLLAVAGESGRVTLWPTDLWYCVGTLTGDSPVDAVAIRPHNGTIATASQDKKVRLWSPSSLQPFNGFTSSEPATCLAFNPGGATLAIAVGRSVTFVDATSITISGTATTESTIDTIAYDRAGTSLGCRCVDGTFASLRSGT